MLNMDSLLQTFTVPVIKTEELEETTDINLKNEVKNWDFEVRRKFLRHIFFTNERDLNTNMKDYVASLKERAVHFNDKVMLKEKILNHMKILHLCFKGREQHYVADLNYYGYMEEILTTYCNLELTLARHLRINEMPTKEYNHQINAISRRICRTVNAFLEVKKHILHVLIKITFRSNIHAHQCIMRLLFMHFLLELPLESQSDEAFCRYYLAFERYKEVSPEDSRSKMDDILFFRFKKGPDFLQTSDIMRKVLRPTNYSLSGIINHIIDYNSVIVQAYFDYMRDKNCDELPDVTNILNIQDNNEYSRDESNFSRVYNDVLKSFTKKPAHKEVKEEECIELDSDSDVAETSEGQLLLILGDSDDEISEIAFMENTINNKHKSRKKRKQRNSYPVVSYIDLDSDIPSTSSCQEVTQNSSSTTTTSSISTSGQPLLLNSESHTVNKLQQTLRTSVSDNSVVVNEHTQFNEQNKSTFKTVEIQTDQSTPESNQLMRNSVNVETSEFMKQSNPKEICMNLVHHNHEEGSKGNHQLCEGSYRNNHSIEKQSLALKNSDKNNQSMDADTSDSEVEIIDHVMTEKNEKLNLRKKTEDQKLNCSKDQGTSNISISSVLASDQQLSLNSNESSTKTCEGYTSIIENSQIVGSKASKNNNYKFQEGFNKEVQKHDNVEKVISMNKESIASCDNVIQVIDDDDDDDDKMEFEVFENTLAVLGDELLKKNSMNYEIGSIMMQNIANINAIEKGNNSLSSKTEFNKSNTQEEVDIESSTFTNKRESLYSKKLENLSDVKNNSSKPELLQESLFTASRQGITERKSCNTTAEQIYSNNLPENNTADCVNNNKIMKFENEEGEKCRNGNYVSLSKKSATNSNGFQLNKIKTLQLYIDSDTNTNTNSDKRQNEVKIEGINKSLKTRNNGNLLEQVSVEFPPTGNNELLSNTSEVDKTVVCPLMLKDSQIQLSGNDNSSDIVKKTDAIVANNSYYKVTENKEHLSKTSDAEETVVHPLMLKDSQIQLYGKDNTSDIVEKADVNVANNSHKIINSSVDNKVSFESEINHSSFGNQKINECNNEIKLDDSTLEKANNKTERKDDKYNIKIKLDDSTLEKANNKAERMDDKTSSENISQVTNGLGNNIAIIYKQGKTLFSELERPLNSSNLISPKVLNLSPNSDIHGLNHDQSTEQEHQNISFNENIQESFVAQAKAEEKHHDENTGKENQNNNCNENAEACSVIEVESEKMDHDQNATEKENRNNNCTENEEESFVAEAETDEQDVVSEGSTENLEGSFAAEETILQSSVSENLIETSVANETILQSSVTENFIEINVAEETVEQLSTSEINTENHENSFVNEETVIQKSTSEVCVENVEDVMQPSVAEQIENLEESFVAEETIVQLPVSEFSAKSLEESYMTLGQELNSENLETSFATEKIVVQSEINTENMEDSYINSENVESFTAEETVVQPAIPELTVIQPQVVWPCPNLSALSINTSNLLIYNFVLDNRLSEVNNIIEISSNAGIEYSEETSKNDVINNIEENSVIKDNTEANVTDESLGLKEKSNTDGINESASAKVPLYPSATIQDFISVSKDFVTDVSDGKNSTNNHDDNVELIEPDEIDEEDTSVNNNKQKVDARKTVYKSESVKNVTLEEFSKIEKKYNKYLKSSEKDEFEDAFSGPVTKLNNSTSTNSLFYENSNGFKFDLFSLAKTQPFFCPNLGDKDFDATRNSPTSSRSGSPTVSPEYEIFDWTDFGKYVEQRNIEWKDSPKRKTKRRDSRASEKTKPIKRCKFSDNVQTRIIDSDSEYSDHIVPIDGFKSVNFKNKCRNVIWRGIKCYIDPTDKKLGLDTSVALNRVSDKEVAYRMYRRYTDRTIYQDLESNSRLRHNTSRSCIQQKIDFEKDNMSPRTHSGVGNVSSKYLEDYSALGVGRLNPSNYAPTTRISVKGMVDNTYLDYVNNKNNHEQPEYGNNVSSNSIEVKTSNLQPEVHNSSKFSSSSEPNAKSISFDSSKLTIPVKVKSPDLHSTPNTESSENTRMISSDSFKLTIPVKEKSLDMQSNFPIFLSNSEPNAKITSKPVKVESSDLHSTTKFLSNLDVSENTRMISSDYLKLTIPVKEKSPDLHSEFSNSPKFLSNSEQLVQDCVAKTLEEDHEMSSAQSDILLLSDHSNFYLETGNNHQILNILPGNLMFTTQDLIAGSLNIINNFDPAEQEEIDVVGISQSNSVNCNNDDTDDISDLVIFKNTTANVDCLHQKNEEVLADFGCKNNADDDFSKASSNYLVDDLYNYVINDKMNDFKTTNTTCTVDFGCLNNPPTTPLSQCIPENLNYLDNSQLYKQNSVAYTHVSTENILGKPINSKENQTPLGNADPHMIPMSDAIFKTENKEVKNKGKTTRSRTKCGTRRRSASINNNKCASPAAVVTSTNSTAFNLHKMSNSTTGNLNVFNMQPQTSTSNYTKNYSLSGPGTAEKLPLNHNENYGTYSFNTTKTYAQTNNCNKITPAENIYSQKINNYSNSHVNKLPCNYEHNCNYKVPAHNSEKFAADMTHSLNQPPPNYIMNSTFIKKTDANVDNLLTSVTEVSNTNKEYIKLLSNFIPRESINYNTSSYKSSGDNTSQIYSVPNYDRISTSTKQFSVNTDVTSNKKDLNKSFHSNNVQENYVAPVPNRPNKLNPENANLPTQKLNVNTYNGNSIVGNDIIHKQINHSMIDNNKYSTGKSPNLYEVNKLPPAPVNTHSNVKYLNEIQATLHARKAGEKIMPRKRKCNENVDVSINNTFKENIDNRPIIEKQKSINCASSSNKDNNIIPASELSPNSSSIEDDHEFNEEEINTFLRILNNGSETSLPFKKRRRSVKQGLNNYVIQEEQISYPATPMISIAEVEALQSKNTVRSFKTPAERKEMPPLPTQVAPLISEQININNHTYINPIINCQMHATTTFLQLPVYHPAANNQVFLKVNSQDVNSDNNSLEFQQLNLGAVANE